VRDVQAAAKAGDYIALVDAREALDAFIIEHSYVEGGGSVQDVLETLSAEAFDSLVMALMGGGVPDVPPVS
jgi:hypothetical protein